MKWKNLILIPLVGLLLLGSMQTVLAEEVVTASIPVSVQIKGGTEDIARLSGEPFSLSLMDDAGEILDTKEVTPDRATGKGNAEFQVRLDQPKDFTFYVFQNPSKNLPEYWTEPTEYRVDVHVVYDAEGNLTAPIRAYKRTAAEEEMETDDPWTKAGEIVFEKSLYAPCLIDPPVEKKVLDETTNTYVEDSTGQFTFVMEPYDEKGDAAKIAATPMPDGKTGGSVELTITGTTSPAPDNPELGPEYPQFQDSTGKSTDMGIIRYYEAGEWDYQIYEKSASPAAGYEKDDEVYYVHVSVTLDEANKTYVAERTYYSKKTGQEVKRHPSNLSINCTV